MANLSYCRWENTLTDLKDCEENLLEEFSSISKEEYHNKASLIVLCKKIINAQNEYIPDIDEIEYLISLSTVSKVRKYVIKNALLAFSYDALREIADYQAKYYPDNTVFADILIDVVKSEYPEMIDHEKP